jgi:hypothetical protein
MRRRKRWFKFGLLLPEVKPKPVEPEPRIDV